MLPILDLERGGIFLDQRARLGPGFWGVWLDELGGHPGLAHE